MMYPLVRELAAADAPHRVPVAVTCRVLGLARQPYYRWLDRPVTDAEIAEAYRDIRHLSSLRHYADKLSNQPVTFTQTDN
ncbi:hypothetical protein ACIF9R_32825 [Streptomyces sp. NPDC086080]|uniref:hypothetical protein n=1 Tax=Streptomyces sp. NPDC086080 TaxID=3365748 RepID=UPI0037D3C50C